MPAASAAPPTFMTTFVTEDGRSAAGAGPAGTVHAFADAFATGAGAVLTTCLNRSTSVTVASVGRLSAPALPDQVPRPWIVLRPTDARGLPGAHSLILPLAAALVLARTAVGDAAVQSGGLTSAGEDALKQTVSEMLAAAATTLGTVLQRPRSFGPVTLSLAEGLDALPPDLIDARDPGWAVRCAICADDGFQTSVVLTVASTLAQEMGRTSACAPTGGGVNGGGAPGRTEAGPARLDMLLDISLPITVELGRTRMQIQDILELGPGSIVELEKSAGDPVELWINDRPIAKGEVVVIDENFGIRLTSIVTAPERIRTLR